MSEKTFHASLKLSALAPDLLEDGEEFSYTYAGNPPRLIMVATGETALILSGLASSLTSLIEKG